MNHLSRKSAFTLIELLVVISIILIASSIIFIGGSGGDGTKLSSSQRIVSGIAQGARGQAILKNAETRLIIYSENQAANALDEEKLLRFFGIVYWGTDADGVEGWMAATQGTYLPEGIYFNPDATPSGDPNPWAKNTMKLDYPRLKVGANTSRLSGGSGASGYYYYKFNSNGTMGSGSDNAWLILQAGTLKPENGELTVDFDEVEKQGFKSALIFRRAGSTTPVNDPSDIN